MKKVVKIAKTEGLIRSLDIIVDKDDYAKRYDSSLH